ncbi:MAG TPA: uroporphyrinogen-III synthase [Candidatus Saccharimonadales bacterium]|nr:uroporphyrinogen-III synthase [Candidatus Saccharimonadales bacterium]
MVVINTRPEPDNKEFTKKLQLQGFTVYEFPTIRTTENMDNKHVVKTLTNLPSFDWILFTSVKGVEAFITIAQLKIKQEIYANKKIAVVGPKTAERVELHGLTVSFMPSQFTTHHLGKELANINNKKVLLARSDIASKQLAIDLQTKGAEVVDIPVYKTEYLTYPDPEIDKLLQKDAIDVITFTSPSTVHGFFKRIANKKLQAKIYDIPVISIGPVTTKTAEKYGFKHIFTAIEYTTEGMIKKMQEL